VHTFHEEALLALKDLAIYAAPFPTVYLRLDTKLSSNSRVMKFTEVGSMQNTINCIPYYFLLIGYLHHHLYKDYTAYD
jgi:hypothetical protein